MLKRYLVYMTRSFLIIISCIFVAGIFSCTCFSKKVERLSSVISFNYPGLRLETRSIKISSLKEAGQIVLCFGDSVTFGWNLKTTESYPYILGDLLQTELKDVVIINSGIGGDTTYGGLKRVERDVTRFSPDLTIVNFGLNDAMLSRFVDDRSGWGGLYFEKEGRYMVPYLSITEFEKNYREIISNLNGDNIKVIILGINSVHEEFPESESKEFRKKQKEIFKVYNERIKSISENTGTPYIDLWSVFEDMDKNGHLYTGRRHSSFCQGPEINSRDHK